MSTNKKTVEPEFDEERAYEELRIIFIIAIQTQNFENLENAITAWQNKYPLSKFTDPEILRKVKAILNKDFLTRLVGDYLAAKILQEKQKQQEAYRSLQKIIQDAEKTKDYKAAERQVKRWKAKLADNQLTLYGFDRYYRSKIFTLLLIPQKKLKDETEATRALKQLYDKSKNLTSDELSKEITDWQRKHCVGNFNKDLQSELNSITADIFKSIADKRNEENCVKDLHNLASKNSIDKPFDSLSSTLAKYDYTKFSRNTQNEIDSLSKQILAIPDLQPAKVEEPEKDEIKPRKNTSITEFDSLHSLQNIFDKNVHDMSALINWIYDNRKVSFSEYSRGEIVRLFTNAGYKIPSQASYSIPEISNDLIHQNSSEINRVQLDVIQNYLGIISTGKTLSKTNKENVLAASTSSNIIDAILKNDQEPESSIILPVYDTLQDKKAEEPHFENTEPEESLDDTVIIDDDFFSNPSSVVIPLKPKEDSKDLSSKDISNERPAIVIPVFTTEKDSADFEVSQVNPVIQTVNEQPDSTDIHDGNDALEDIITTELSSFEDSKIDVATSESSPSYSLVGENLENIETAQDAITYIGIAYPMLRYLMREEKALIHEPEKDPFDIQKNSGF